MPDNGFAIDCDAGKFIPDAVELMFDFNIVANGVGDQIVFDEPVDERFVAWRIAEVHTCSGACYFIFSDDPIPCRTFCTDTHTLLVCAVMDNVQIGSGSIIAAGAVVLENTVVEPGSIYAGVPAKKVKSVSESLQKQEIERISNNYLMYSTWFK